MCFHVAIFECPIPSKSISKRWICSHDLVFVVLRILNRNRSSTAHPPLREAVLLVHITTLGSTYWQPYRTIICKLLCHNAAVSRRNLFRYKFPLCRTIVLGIAIIGHFVIRATLSNPKSITKAGIAINPTITTQKVQGAFVSSKLARRCRGSQLFSTRPQILSTTFLRVLPRQSI